MKRSMALAIALVVFSISAQAQQVFRVGDAIELQDGSRWIPGVIESVDNNIAKVRIGKGKYDYINVQLPTTRFRVPGSAAREAKDNALREAFRKRNQQILSDRQTVRAFLRRQIHLRRRAERGRGMAKSHERSGRIGFLM